MSNNIITIPWEMNYGAFCCRSINLYLYVAVLVRIWPYGPRFVSAHVVEIVSNKRLYQHLVSNTSALHAWWRHQMETFSALLASCAGNSPVTGEFPAQRPVTRSCDVFFDLRLNKRLSKQSWGWWFDTPSHPLWRHCNETILSTQSALIKLLSVKKNLAEFAPFQKHFLST